MSPSKANLHEDGIYKLLTWTLCKYHFYINKHIPTLVLDQAMVVKTDETEFNGLVFQLSRATKIRLEGK